MEASDGGWALFLGSVCPPFLRKRPRFIYLSIQQCKKISGAQLSTDRILVPGTSIPGRPILFVGGQKPGCFHNSPITFI